MDKKFINRSPVGPRLKTRQDDGTNFWMTTQLLSAIDDSQNVAKTEISIALSKSIDSSLGETCIFCKSCFRETPAPGETKRENRPAGLRGVRTVGKKCPTCIFFLSVINMKRGDTPLKDPSTFSVRVRIPNGQRSDPIVDIGLEVGDTYNSWKTILAFCPVSNKASRRAIWGRRFPIDLTMRASLLHEWLNKCKDSHHEQCSHIKMPGHPSRLLYIESSATPPSVRLVTAEAFSSTPEYVALSHCWGEGSPLCTTTKNLEDFSKSIPIDKLPRTFADALSVTYSLGLAYLWIDSLCILQDSQPDWEFESSQMSRIYENALVTIAASSAVDSSEGLYLTLDKSLSLSVGRNSSPNCLQKFGLFSQSGTIRSEVANPFTVHMSPLNKRGWTFQEVILSRRIIYFTKDQIYWQCREVVESEDGTIRTTWREREFRKGTNRSMLGPNLIFETSINHLWWGWAMDYSRRLFTFPADRLFACAGITQYYSKLTNSKAPVLGLLRDSMETQLLWALEGVDVPTPRSNSSANLPSWTWLSRHAPLLDINALIHSSFDLAAFVQDVELTWMGPELTSPLKRAAIKIVGRVITMQVGRRHQPSTSTTSVELIACNVAPSNSSPVGKCSETTTEKENTPIVYSALGIFDDEAPKKGTKVLCLEMLKSIAPGPAIATRIPNLRYLEQKMLILKPVDTAAKECERIGVGFVRYDEPGAAESVFDTVDYQEGVLV